MKSLAIVPIGKDEPVAAIGAYWATPHEATPHELAALEELAECTNEAIERVGFDGAPILPDLGNEAAPGAVGPTTGTGNVVRFTDDHERIARDLHDTVLQRMFGAGLQLQMLRSKLSDHETREGISAVVNEIDQAIRELRGVVFGLEYGHDDLGGVNGEILVVVAEASRTLGFGPAVNLDGALEGVGDRLRYEFVGVLRELLSNVSRHANASAVTVDVAVGPSLVLRVTDNGIGLEKDAPRGSGLVNLEHRAELLGGWFSIVPGPRVGTVATWSVPCT